MESIVTKAKRIESIDILRGIVMVLMVLDHVRDFFHISANIDNPLNLATTTPLLYTTRWITHFCAPTFIFLSGVSVYLQSMRKTKKELSAFLIKRGLWLILLEVLVISFAWSFNPFYNLLFLQVIWAIGICMIILGILIYLPFNFLLALGLLIVFGHNLLDIFEASPNFKTNLFYDLLHHGNFSVYPYAPNHAIFIVYAFLPYLGLMILGYCIGKLYSPVYSKERRQKILIQIGFGLIFLFIGLRYFNFYGDPVPWSSQKNSLYSFLSFMNVNKYPPSLLYICITIGPALLVLFLLENIQNRLTNFMAVFGKTAFFYYIIHLYLIHFLASICFFARGHSFEEGISRDKMLPFNFVIPGEGFGLTGVYLTWIFIVIALYPLCKRYGKYKFDHPEKWWLSYL